MWPSVQVRRVSELRDKDFVGYRASVRLEDERTTIRVKVEKKAPHADQAETAIRLRIFRELNEMPPGRDWIGYLKELEPLELTRRDL